MNNKDLNLDAKRIEEVLNTLDGCTCKKTSGNAQQEVYQILRRSDSANPKISIYHKQGGKTSLVVGGSPQYKEFGEEIIALIVEKTQTISLGKINDIIIVDSDDFEKLLANLDFTKITLKEISGGTEYTYVGEHKEKFVFYYYTKKSKLQLIGAPLTFLMEILTILDSMGYSATKNIIEKAIEITLDTPDLWSEYMPKSKTVLSKTLRNIVEPSMIYVKVSIPLTDYASHLNPVLRGMESSIRKILEDNGIEVDEKRFNVFTKSSGIYILKVEYHGDITDIIRKRVEKCYNFYNKHRHSLFHASDEPMEIRCIERRDDALELLFKSFEMMEELHE